MPQLPEDSTLTAQLCSLIRSNDCKDWLRAWELIRDRMPEQVTTFHELDVLFGLDAHGCFISDLLYDLEMALHNEGLEDHRLTAKRADIAQWVYTHFTEEDTEEYGEYFNVASTPFQTATTCHPGGSLAGTIPSRLIG